jgi:CheY-like chemotaxis protein/HPt (histidine-containing phosphotransfer) domain-containing protein
MSALRVLVVDDSPLCRTVTVRMLEHLGHRAESVGNGVQALCELARSRFDAILMDCNMPKMDGVATTTAIRKREEPAQRTVILGVTAGTRRGEQDRCLAAGMDGFLPKPFDMEQLAAALESVFLTGRGQSNPAVATAGMGLALERLSSICASRGEMASILKIALEDARVAVARLGEALANGDAVAVARAAHTLRGISHNVGASALAARSADLETLAPSASREDLAALHASLVREFEPVERELLRRLNARSET